MKLALTTVIQKILAGDDRYFTLLVNEFSADLLPVARYHLMSSYCQTSDV